MPEAVNVVHKVMDGEKLDIARLSPKEIEYYKTAGY